MTALDDQFEDAGKELLDVVLAFVDPSQDRNKIAEIQEAATKLWNLAGVARKEPLDCALHVLVGALNSYADTKHPIGE